MKKSWFVLLTLSLILLTTSSCTPTPPPATLPPCPPYGAYYKTPALPGGDVSSGEIYVGTYAIQSSGSPWCTPNAITIAVVDVTTLPPCPTAKGCLKAIDLGPDNLGFGGSSVSSRPQLTFDLSDHPTLSKDACSGYTCYEIYQLNKTTSTWLSVGGAAASSVNGIQVAQGNVNHFTVFGVVELPPPAPPSGNDVADVIVASEFVLDTQGELDVSFQINKSELPELQSGGERLFRFAGMNEKAEYTFTGEMPDPCKNVTPFDAQLSCFFPVGTAVTITININDSVFTITTDGNFVVQWHSTVIVIY